MTPERYSAEWYEEQRRKGVQIRSGVEFVWVVCDAPAGFCGGRRCRQRVPVDKLHCRTCGSQVRVCKNQKAKP